MALGYKKLSRASVRSMVTGAKITEHGITAERLANGDVAYSVNIMVDGERIHRTAGRESEGVTREQAERIVETLRSDARAGRLNLPAGRKTHPSFAEASGEYLERMFKTGGKDMANKKRHVEQQLVPFFGNIRVNKLTTALIKEYAQKRLTAAKQATVNRELATLSHCLNRLVDWKQIKAEDRPRIEKGSEPRKPIDVLTEEQANALMAAAMNDSDPRLYLFVAFGLNAAMRHSEIVRARYDQVDFAARRVFIPLAKAGEREQPITPSLTSMLRERQKIEADPGGWIFPARSSARTEEARRSHRQSMDYGFRRAVTAAGLDPKKVTPHVMRHTAITRLVKAGVDVPTIQRISGHKTLGMVMRYVHIHGSHIDTAISALDTVGGPFTRNLQGTVWEGGAGSGLGS